MPPNMTVLVRYGRIGGRTYAFPVWTKLEDTDRHVDMLLTECDCKVAVIPVHVVDFTPAKADSWVQMLYRILPGDGSDSAWDYVMRGRLGRVERVVERNRTHKLRAAMNAVEQARDEVAYAEDEVAEAQHRLEQANNNLVAAEAAVAELQKGD